MMRVAVFFLLVCVGIVGPWWVVFVCAGLYALWFLDAYELIALGICLDSLFGMETPYTPFPIVYTLGLSVVLLAMYHLRPFMRLS